MQVLLDLLKRFGAVRLAAMGGVTLALLAFFGFVILKATQPGMATLFTDLDERDSAAIVKELEAAGVPYELGPDGSSVRAPADQVTRLRMSMAADGLPSGGGIGYEIFDKGDSLSATSFVQNLNGLRALEGELGRTIRSIDRVESARVHLVIPERTLFQQDRQDPSASIALKVRGTLAAGQIKAIRHLVASAVEGLKPERISIVDESGALLADGSGGDGSDANADDRQSALSARLTDQVRGIVESVVGPGRARVQVSAELDLSRSTQTQDTYDPDSKVVRSTQTSDESQASLGQGHDGQVSVGTQLPNANGAAGQAPVTDQSKKSQETVNYEISRTTRTVATDPGGIKRLSVAVLVDGTYGKDAAYTPRSQEDLDRITALVRSGIGFDQGRGDQVTVVNLRFAEAPTMADAATDGGFMVNLAPTREDVLRLVQLGVLGVLSALVLLVVVRPLVRRVTAPPPPPEPLVLPTEDKAAEVPALPTPEESRMLEHIHMAEVNSQIQQKSIERIGELVERNPTETMTLIRTWLAEPAS